jgi:hypothetical protein
VTPYYANFTITRQDGTPELVCEALYDGADGEPWSVHISERERDVRPGHSYVAAHRCACDSGKPCQTVSHERLIVTPPEDAHMQDIIRRFAAIRQGAR